LEIIPVVLELLLLDVLVLRAEKREIGLWIGLELRVSLIR
jgi:hypothetical protein